MKEFFKETNFREQTKALIYEANSIILEYRNAGLTLTLRQLYYQFVARDKISNSKKSYDNLGAIISKGRLAGLIDWYAIEDRTRFLRGNTTWNKPSDMISYYAENYRIDMWENQEVRVEVWIEKDALIGVIDKVCRDNGVNYFACRGYVSQSELFRAGKRMEKYISNGQEVVVLHLGDHDPSGMDMTRDNEERLCMFAGNNITVKRIALNMSQVKQYNPPPNPAKLTDSRAKKYIPKYGADSWELDALEPRVMEKLIQSEIDGYKNPDLWDEKETELFEHTEKLRDVVHAVENGYL